MKNVFVWVDIPVRDLDRAMRFYSAVIGGEVSPIEIPGVRFGIFPNEPGVVSGCLITPHEAVNGPSVGGALVYFNVDGRLGEAVAAAETNGGKVDVAAHQIAEHGFRALVIDSEGNRIALHSMTM